MDVLELPSSVLKKAGSVQVFPGSQLPGEKSDCPAERTTCCEEAGASDLERQRSCGGRLR